MKQKKLIISLIITIALVLFLAVSVSTAPHAKRSLKTINYSLNVNTAANPTNNVNVFSSSTLGIRFSYMAESFGDIIHTKEAGNTVYVYTQGTVPEQGQYVRVWKKDPSKTLAQTIEQKFLSGYDPKKCFVDTEQTIVKDINSGVGAVISFPMVANSTDPWWEAGKNCPDGYRLTNERSFFWSSSQTASTFVYFSLGQSLIKGTEGGKSWAETLEFI